MWCVLDESVARNKPDDLFLVYSGKKMNRGISQEVKSVTK